ncbi:dihydrolipoamide dehydrogenase [Lactarius indigo]|nr:dihydrolipoamide dehydrogenase [Lactarius indigo]
MLVVPKASKSVSIPRDVLRPWSHVGLCLLVDSVVTCTAHSLHGLAGWPLPAVNTRTGGRFETTEVEVLNGRWFVGPGDYVAAIKATRLSLKTACIENPGTLGGTCLNIGCIPSKAMPNNSHIYHRILHDIKKRGIDVKGVKLNFPQMLKAKEHSVNGLTKGIEILFKKNKVNYIKGTASFSISIAARSEVTPFPGGAIEIDVQQIVSSTGALPLHKVPEKIVVFGGDIIGLEMGSVWSRLGAKVTVVELVNSIGGAGIDEEISKQFQKPLTKQGLKFDLSTKVLSAEKKDGKVVVTMEAAKDGKQDSSLSAADHTRKASASKIMPNIKCIGDVISGPMLTHKAEEGGIAAVEYIHSGHAHVNYGTIPSVVYTHPEVTWVQGFKTDGVKYKVRFLVDAETDRILGVHIIGSNTGEIIAEGVFALNYGASAENIARTTHAHPTLFEAFREAALHVSSGSVIHF